MGISTGDQSGAKAQVMVLGTYHMANPGRDLVKSSIRDTMGAERQSEIQMLESRLARFNPTKIAVEAMAGGLTKERYIAYCQGKVELSPNEIEQVGFRLAKTLGHEEIFPVDYAADMDFEGLAAFAQAEKQTWFLHLLDSMPGEVGRKMEEVDRQFTVSQILALYNSPGFYRFSQSFYMDMLRVNAGDKYPGVDVVAGWYRRNMVIYANIRRVIDSPRDRVLVIYGAGHAKLLSDFVYDASDLIHVDPLEFLPDVPPFRLI